MGTQLQTGRATQETFFRRVFGKHEGIVCVARIHRASKAFHEQFFVYDHDELDEIVEFVQRWGMEQDLYVAPFFFSTTRRTKETIDSAPAVYADLDECNPDRLLIQPTFTIETSPNRYQALWVFEHLQDPATVEDLSRRVAYYHADDGADKSGWDLTQLLRIPGTSNFKYKLGMGWAQVRVVNVDLHKPTIEEFTELYPQAKGYAYSDIPLPEEAELPQDPDEVLQKHKKRLPPTVFRLFEEEPDGDWSRSLWQLEHMLYEAGLSREEAFVVCRNAACNKYQRDKRPPALLWKEICKCFTQRELEYSLHGGIDDERPLLTDAELDLAINTHTIVEEYIDWAKTVGDAAWQYHQASAFIILSSLLAGYVKLPTSFGTVLPNMWFMLLADTTLTRKTTAMDLGMDLLAEIDPDAVLATDGSIEGLFTALALRPGRPSVFLRDEFSGLLDAMTKKDYMAGMAESLTKLYDGKFQKRILRKETIEVRNPVLILFAGGIKSRILQLFNYEHVASGFMPRFVFITAESDLSRVRPLGPPTEKSIGERDRIRGRLATIAGHYARPIDMEVQGKSILHRREWNAELTDGAWARYNKFEADLLALGLESRQKELLTPTYDRLAKTGLKAATLIAASRRLEDKIVITETDLIKAFSFVEYWRGYTKEVLDNIGKSVGENLLGRISTFVRTNPGVSRSTVMQQFHLTARDTSLYFETLEQRGVVIRHKSGRGERLWIVQGA